jgi:hypothetical protein
MLLRVWASTGFHPASPGPARALAPHSWPGCQPGPCEPLLTSGVTNRSRPRWAARGSDSGTGWCRPVSGLDAKRRLSGEAAIERPINSPSRNVKRSRRPPGATRRVSSQLLTSTYHPEHGEAGRGQRLIAHTRQEHPAAPLVRPSDQGCPRRGPYLYSACFRTARAIIRMALIADILEAATAPITCPLRACRPAAPPGNHWTARHRPARRLDREKPLPAFAEGRAASLSGCYGKKGFGPP